MRSRAGGASWRTRPMSSERPLWIIRAELEVTLSNPEPTVEEFAAMAAAVGEASDRSERLIDSLLTLARSEGAVVGDRVADLGAAVEEVVALLEPAAAARSIRLEGSVALAEVRGDEVLLQRSIENLVENAIRYNVRGGWVAISTETRGGMVRVAVRNGGEVIPAEEVDCLFEPFRRRGLDRVESERGIGLGLAIVRAVTKAHGGTISATAPPEGGLEVLVELPSVGASKGLRESAPLHIG
jgi:signal transduction histidine kinase